MTSILVVEDNKDFNTILCDYLKKKGYSITGAFDGLSAFDLMEHKKFDLIISDIMMPNMDGYEFAENVRSYDKNIPILFITAREDFSSKEKSYNIGIDDYMVKPINMDELNLRITALLKRANIVNEKKLIINDFIMNTDENVAYFKDEKIDLSVKEFNILFKLLSYPKKTFTRLELMDEFWGMDSDTTPRTVDVYITKIREKCNKVNYFSIETVHGLGYKAIIKEDKNE